MSCPLPMKSFFLSISLTSSPINWEECPQSLHWYCLSSPSSQSFSVCLSLSLFSKFSNSMFVCVLPFLVFLSLSLAACLLIGKRCCVMHFLKQRERERENAAGALIHHADSWLSGLLFSVVVDHRPYILLSDTVGCSLPLPMAIDHYELLVDKCLFVQLNRSVISSIHFCISFSSSS